MKSIMAMLLSVLLCVQSVCTLPVCAMSERVPILYEDIQEKQGEGSEDAQKDAGGEEEDTQDDTGEGNEDTQKDAGGQEEDALDDTSEGNEDTQDQGNVAGGMTVSAPSAILMEASTGQVIFEKDADTKRPPASVTKVMTLLLIFDALNNGKISLEEEVTTSEYAASMGGSQVFLEPGEIQTVDTMIKCISVASANDACAALKDSRHFVMYCVRRWCELKTMYEKLSGNPVYK